MIYDNDIADYVASKTATSTPPSGELVRVSVGKLICEQQGDYTQRRARTLSGVEGTCQITDPT